MPFEVYLLDVHHDLDIINDGIGSEAMQAHDEYRDSIAGDFSGHRISPLVIVLAVPEITFPARINDRPDMRG